MTSKKNLTNSIMNKNQLKELKERLKIITDAINYQDFLYGTERKRNVRLGITNKINKYEKLKKEIESQIKEHPVTVERKDKREKKKQEKSASKIQKWFRRQYTEKIKYSVHILLFSIFNTVLMSEEELNKIKEEYRRKKIKFFFRFVYYKTTNEIKKEMFTQKAKPAHILIKMNKNEYERYNEKYTYNVQVLKDRYKQMVLDNQGNLSKPQQKSAFHNTDEDYYKLVSICKKDENFNEIYNKYGSYIDTIYLYDASSLSNKTDPFELIDTDMYQAIDSNAICFKHIDYTLNKEAKTFKDMFEFAEANKSISSNLNANSCFFYSYYCNL